MPSYTSKLARHLVLPIEGAWRGIFAPSVVIFGKRFVDIGFGYAFLAFASIPSYASKLPCRLAVSMGA